MLQSIADNEKDTLADIRLRLQKKSVLRGMIESLAATLFSLILYVATPTAIFLTSSEPQHKTAFWFVILPLTILLTTILCISFIEFLRLYLRIKHIQHSHSCKVSISCQKVRFMCRSGKSNLVVCVILIDETGERYYYVYPKGSEPHYEFEAEQIQQRILNTTMELNCYLDTNITTFLDI